MENSSKFSITKLSLRDMTECGKALRRCGQDATCMAEAGQRIVRYLYAQLGDAAGEPACVLARLFKTHPLGQLPPGLRELAERQKGSAPLTPTTKCLTLLATVGSEPRWNDCEASQRHQVIPLPDTHTVASLPMIARLMHQLGIDVENLLMPDAGLFPDPMQEGSHVFYVPDALRSPYVPAQRDFVVPYGVRSVLGFGGVLPSREAFALILFARISVPPETACIFKPLAINAKLALIPFDGAATFTQEAQHCDSCSRSSAK